MKITNYYCFYIIFIIWSDSYVYLICINILYSWKIKLSIIILKMNLARSWIFDIFKFPSSNKNTSYATNTYDNIRVIFIKNINKYHKNRLSLYFLDLEWILYFKWLSFISFTLLYKNCEKMRAMNLFTKLRCGLGVINQNRLV